jgi:hypothetical protein
MNHSTGRGQDRWPAGGSLRLGIFAVVLAGAALLAAACGGGSHPATSVASGQLTAPKLDAFAQCMRSHGLYGFYFSEANPSSGDTMFGYGIPANIHPNSPQFQAALSACRHIVGVPSGPPPGVTAAQLRGLVRAAECMRTHGYPSFADPVVKNGGIGTPALPSSVDTNSPQFQAALKKCGAATPGGFTAGG